MNKVVLLVALFVCSTLSAVEPEVKGSLTANGVSAKFTHVMTYEIDSPTEKGYMDNVVILSDRKLSREEALSEEKLQELTTSKKLVALRVILDPDCKVKSTAPYHPALKVFLSSAALIKWKPSAYDVDKVAGRFWTDGTQEMGSQKWSYDVTFTSPIVLDPEAKTVDKK